MSDNEEVRVKAVEVDLNSLDLVDEQVDISVEADAFAGPPPAPDGDHLVKLSLGPKKVLSGKAKDGRPFYMLHIRADIQPGDEYEGRVMFTNVGTMVMQNTGTSAVVGVLKAVRDQVSPRESILELARRLKNRLDGNPECLVTSQWQAYCADCKAEFDATDGKKGKKGGIVLRGQKRFPQNGNGHNRHQVECPNCGSMLTAQAAIIAFKPSAA